MPNRTGRNRNNDSTRDGSGASVAFDRFGALVARPLLAVVVVTAALAMESASIADDATTPPSLDELLGLERDPAVDDGAAEAERRRQEALRRRLTEEERQEAFLTAVDDMRRSAELLGDTMDTGLGTQRLQESILEKLEILLRQPPRRDQSSPDSSDDPSPESGDPQDAPAQPTPADGAASGSAEDAAPDSEPGDPSAAEASLLEEALKASGAEWGALPDRVRDEIRQGLRERPSSLYERLTEAYYRRLAEESSR